jgi:hypothetical protein
MHHPYSPTRRFRLGVGRSRPQAENRNNSTSVLRRDFRPYLYLSRMRPRAMEVTGSGASDGVPAHSYHVFCSWKTPEPTPLAGRIQRGISTPAVDSARIADFAPFCWPQVGQLSSGHLLLFLNHFHIRFRNSQTLPRRLLCGSRAPSVSAEPLRKMRLNEARHPTARHRCTAICTWCRCSPRSECRVRARYWLPFLRSRCLYPQQTDQATPSPFNSRHIGFAGRQRARPDDSFWLAAGLATAESEPRRGRSASKIVDKP